VNFIKACQHPNGGFGGNIGHDAHITSTLYALLILSMFDEVSSVNTDKIAEYMVSL
jgi:geranylgeranyl transferase type-2 subunit beta